MQPIPFRQNPAFVTVTDAVGLAVEHLRRNAILWLLPTVAYGALSGALTYAMTARFAGVLRPGRVDPDAGVRVLELVRDNLPGIVAFVVLLFVVGIAFTALTYALAVGGLPRREMTLDRAVTAGVRVILAGLLYGVLASLVGVVAILVLVLLASRAAVLLVLAVPLLVVLLAYVSLRLILFPIAIFDGHGIVDGLRTSWRLTRGGVWRTVGWLALLFLISIGVGLAGTVASLPFAGMAIIGAVVSTVLTAVLQVFQATMLAILYESQRMRDVMSTPGMSWLPGSTPPDPGSTAPIPTASGSDPLLPPPPPLAG